MFVLIGVAWVAGFFDGRKGGKRSGRAVSAHGPGWLRSEIEGIREDAAKQLKRKRGRR